VAASEQAAAHAARDLAMIGFDNVVGWLGPDALEDWMNDRGHLAMIKVVHPSELHAEQKNGRQLIDVRGAGEWHAGHIPGAIHIPLGNVAHEFANADRNKSLVMQCQGGTRSQIALSILKKLGFTDVLNLTGGYGECIKIGMPVTKDQ
jgi:hydroxyacylglutathione hydrolase